MSALAFDFDFGPADGVATAPATRPRLYAVRGSTVDAPRARTVPALTLDALLGGAWTALAAGAPAACPVCAGMLVSRAGGAGASCGGCGSTLD